MVPLVAGSNPACPTRSTDMQKSLPIATACEPPTVGNDLSGRARESLVSMRQRRATLLLFADPQGQHLMQPERVTAGETARIGSMRFTARRCSALRSHKRRNVGKSISRCQICPVLFIAGGLGPSESHKLRVLGAIPRPATGSVCGTTQRVLRNGA